MSNAASSRLMSDRQRWNALVTRDPRADGRFVYAVKTTGIYCRPSCASRQPRRENVVFFVNPQAAEQAGYRPCLKCAPRLDVRLKRTPAAVARACELMNAADELLTLNELASAVEMSPFHLHRSFKSSLGITPKAYAAERRRQRLKAGLRTQRTVSSAIYTAGFRASSRVYEGASEMLGMTPAKYKAGATGVHIRYAIAKSHLGWVLVAATDRGICAIELDDSRRALAEKVSAQFSGASRVSGDAEFAAWVEQVLALIESPAKGLDLPLDMQGTAFQRRVWEALRAIPPGETATYTHIAQRIGRPSAARAVAGACAANPLAIAVPCHRVVRAGGDLSGYRWGVERKRELLEREARDKASH